MEWITTYYGTYNLSHKPKHGVHLMMLDEYIKKTIDKERERFAKDIGIMTERFSRLFHERLDKTDRKTQDIKMLHVDLKKFIGKLAKLNKLTMPVVDKKLKSKKAIKESIEDDGHLGYL